MERKCADTCMKVIYRILPLVHKGDQAMQNYGKFGSYIENLLLLNQICTHELEQQRICVWLISERGVSKPHALCTLMIYIFYIHSL